MISVLLYGRNDAHGYNLHRRAALSLNCIAQVLTDPNDEIIFVDYNTPDELPTFVEAISDTLTDRCLGLLRVLRVPAAAHRQRFAARTHLPAIEPVARNAAARRADPANRWLLSTNTDMVLLPLVERSLSEICSDLPDGFYGMPRFELPEWLWERLPRDEPRAVLAHLKRLGPDLRLDEPTVSHQWIRFDAPGDFQLILRDDLFAVDGFDEEMLLGYHVDSNMSRRMFLHRGSIESLGEHVAGYHCNHNRVPTVYHGARLVANDLERFFYSVEEAGLPNQRSIWGLADVELEEVPIGERAALGVADQLAATLTRASETRTPSDALASGLGLTYDSGHVLPFVADSLAVASTAVSVAYIGVNSVLEQLLGDLASRLAIRDGLVTADLDELDSIEELHRVADVVVVDLGVDASLVNGSMTAPEGEELAEFPLGLDRVFGALERLIELERAELARGGHPCRIVLVNSATAFWNAYVLAQLDCSHTSVHSRVRRATVKPVADEDEAATAAYEAALRLIRWAARRRAGVGRLSLRVDGAITIANLEDYPGFGEGWAHPDEIGIWTDGPRSELAVALEGTRAGKVVLSLGIDGVCVGPNDAISVELLVNGERAAVRDFSQGRWRSLLHGLRSRPSPQPDPEDAQRADGGERSGVPAAATDSFHKPRRRRRTPAALRKPVSRLLETVWRVELAQEAVAQDTAQLTFVIDQPRSPLALGWSDDKRRLGIHLRSLALEQARN